MTKEQYFELCEMMGTEPVDEEVPVELDDLPYDIQEVIFMYMTFQDNWSPINGAYLGKSFSNVSEVFNMFDIPIVDRNTIYTFLRKIDEIRSNVIRAAKPKQDTKPPL